MTTPAQKLLGIMNEIEEYFDARSDVVDGSYGIPEANEEMRMLQETRDAIRMVEEIIEIAVQNLWRKLRSDDDATNNAHHAR